MPDQEESFDAIFADGILEILTDGRSFLRPADENVESVAYRPAMDDIHVPQPLVARFHLKQGDTVAGRVRPPEPGETYFTLVRIDYLNSRPLLS